jgi:hypothetical protein
MYFVFIASALIFSNVLGFAFADLAWAIRVFLGSMGLEDGAIFMQALA